MKKLKSLFSVAVVVLATVVFAACGAPSYEKLTVNYTSGLEFLVGEDYSDANVTAKATLSDGSTEDVTSKLTINTSEYNKNTMAKYKIYFEFEGMKESCEVSVVDRITTSSIINDRFAKVINNTFGNGAYSFEMTEVTEIDTNTYTTQTIKQTVDASGNIVSYVKWVVTMGSENVTIYEKWYTGTATAGECVDGVEEETTAVSFSEFNDEIALDAASAGAYLGDAVVLLPGNVYDLKANTQTLTGELTKAGDVYTLTSDSTYTYVNNVLTSINGVDVTFGQATIPAVPELTA